MIYSRISNFLIIEKKIFGEFNTKEEREQAQYNLQIILINLEKLLIVYSISYVFGVIVNTLIMNISYFLIRKYAGGWHATNSLTCTLVSTLNFVIIPWIDKILNFEFSTLAVMLQIIPIIVVISRYAPADTEKNPLISISERNEMRWKAIIVTVLSLVLVFFVKDGTIKFNILSGIILECVLIHPVFYKLTKRSYRNYEGYAAIK